MNGAGRRGTVGRAKKLPPSIDVSTMTDIDDKDNQAIIPDGVDDAVVTHADSISVFPG